MKRHVYHITILFIFAGVVGLYYLLFRDETDLCAADPVVCPCLKILPSDKSLDIKFKTSKKGQLNEVEFSGSKNRDDDPSPELAEKFVQCLERVRPDVAVTNFSRLDTAPLGQVAHQWQRATGMKITLRPRDETERAILNNLQIGPISGLRWRIMGRWCADPMAACVQCSEPTPDQDTVAVEVRLREGAPVERRFWSGNWPREGEQEAWELVDAEGRRYLYECVP